ncbi:MAG: sugar ABC transporter substrate-binding protein [Firmicutes bacterium HGW-Firmicutes-14]|nr:MAG: sugar ABC transporter substrate-binding protein [Firmicutes bacterium HGW-Firmicutes-14]
MRRYLKKVSFLLLLVFLAVTALAGCGGAKSEDKGGQAGGDKAFDWKAYSGETIKLALVKHPWTDSVLFQLDSFKSLTGIDVLYDVYPEEEFFNKITVVLSSGSSEYDAFMIGPYQIWQYAPANWLEPLSSYMNSESLTGADWDKEDIYPNILGTDAWDLKMGSQVGTGEQWALPFAFHLNALQYRKDLFEKYDLKVPETIEDVIEVGKVIQQNEKNMYGISVRGTRSWATIHPGFLTGYQSYGAKDFDSNLNPAMNSPEAVAMVEDWIKMVKEVGPPQWTNTTWYEVTNSLGGGQSAMIYDADVLGYFVNSPGSSDQAGNIAWAPGPGKDGPALEPNLYTWSLSINSKSKNKDAAWYFLQWATSKEVQLKGALEKDLVNPIRKSVWENPDFKKRLEGFDNYYQTYQEIIGGANIYYTPEPLFFETTTLWSEALQQVYLGQKTAQQALDGVAEELSKRLKEQGLGK